jgi:hypothetical protein
MMIASTFDALPDDQLLEELQRLVTTERCTVADFLRALMEVDSRRLYLRESCSSLFIYCTQVLHLEESAAYNRIEVARAARRLPALLEAVDDGSITLTSARLLAPHLTVDNHSELLKAARHRSKRAVEVLVASLAPRPPAATVLRKVKTEPAVVEPAPLVTPSAPAPTSVATSTTESASAPVVEPPATSTRPTSLVQAPAGNSNVTALSAGTYKLQVTISTATHDKLRRTRDLLRHALPTGDIAEILDRALTLLLDDLEKRRCAAVTTPREGASLAGRTRHIPAAVKREVWRRDQGRCAFARGSRRCTETAFIEFHHVVPYADGGTATVENIELRCRAHNQYEAMLIFSDQNDVVREAAAAW